MDQGRKTAGSPSPKPSQAKFRNPFEINIFENAFHGIKNLARIQRRIPNKPGNLPGNP
jgi:hypothetical protein